MHKQCYIQLFDLIFTVANVFLNFSIFFFILFIFCFASISSFCSISFLIFLSYSLVNLPNRAFPLLSASLANCAYLSFSFSLFVFSLLLISLDHLCIFLDRLPLSWAFPLFPHCSKVLPFHHILFLKIWQNKINKVYSDY